MISTLEPRLGVVFVKSLENVIPPLLFLIPSPLYDSAERIANGTSYILDIISPMHMPPFAIQTT